VIITLFILIDKKTNIWCIVCKLVLIMNIAEILLTLFQNSNRSINWIYFTPNYNEKYQKILTAHHTSDSTCIILSNMLIFNFTSVFDLHVPVNYKYIQWLKYNTILWVLLSPLCLPCATYLPLCDNVTISCYNEVLTCFFRRIFWFSCFTRFLK
jgi:hypothetical protein